SEEHTSELQSLTNIVCRLLLEKKKSTPQAPARCADGRAGSPRTCAGSRGCRHRVPTRGSAAPLLLARRASFTRLAPSHLLRLYVHDLIVRVSGCRVLPVLSIHYIALSVPHSSFFCIRLFLLPSPPILALA